LHKVKKKFDLYLDIAVLMGFHYNTHELQSSRTQVTGHSIRLTHAKPCTNIER